MTRESSLFGLQCLEIIGRERFFTHVTVGMVRGGSCHLALGPMWCYSVCCGVTAVGIRRYVPFAFALVGLIFCMLVLVNMSSYE